MKSKAFNSIITPVPVVDAPCNTKVGEQNVSAGTLKKPKPTPKPMTDARRRSLLSKDAIRFGTQSHRYVTKMIADLFDCKDGIMEFTFPDGGPSDSTIGAWLLEGDLLKLPFNTVATNPYVPPVPIAQFRMTPDRQMEATAITDSGVKQWIFTVQKILTMVAQQVERDGLAFFREANTQEIEATHLALKDGQKTLLMPTTLAAVDEIVAAAIANDGVRRGLNQKLSAQYAALKFFVRVMNEAVAVMPGMFSDWTLLHIESDLSRNAHLLEGDTFLL